MFTELFYHDLDYHNDISEDFHSTQIQKAVINWFWTFKRITIELILLNPTKFEQIRKFENFRMKKKILKKVRKLKLPCTSTYKPVNIYK